MNISTYEARIAALEAQLGPEPSGKTGIKSITFSPDIQLDNGTLNDALSLLMPLTTEGRTSKSYTTETHMDGYYDVTVVPGDDWYGIVGRTIGDEPGKSVTGRVTLAYEQNQELLAFNIVTTSDPDNDNAPYSKLSIEISGPKKEGMIS